MLFTKLCETKDEGKIIKRNFAKDPAVVFFKGRYLLYFSTLEESDTDSDSNSDSDLNLNKDKFRIGIAESLDLENWTFLTLIPLEGECEKQGVAAPAAFVRDGYVHLFYQTYGNREKDAICHGYSEDGIHFSRNVTNPVFAPTTDWCCGRAIDADVVEFKDNIYLYFATRDHGFNIQKVGVAYTPKDSDFSKASWIQGKNAPCLEPKLLWEKNCIEAPATVVVNEKVYMFYGGAYNCEPQQIGVAVSENGIDFKRLSDTPFMTNGKDGDWNSDESGHPYVFRDEDGSIYLFYQGSPNKGKDWYLSMKKVTISGDRVFTE